MRLEIDCKNTTNYANIQVLILALPHFYVKTLTLKGLQRTMKVFKLKTEIADYLKSEQLKGKKIGFAPTMGALHSGHVSLVEKAKAENDIVVCSIFVNPIQFNNPSDLTKYPRTLDSDLKLLEKVACDVVFVPTALEMYPEPITEKDNMTFGDLDLIMEGKQRPGHFSGVGIVVKKLFEIVNPDKAYFGEKDFQQLAVVRKMVEQEKMAIEVIGCPIIRESDGLAMSSRNTLLNELERKNSANIYRILSEAKLLTKSMNVAQLKEWVKTEINKIETLSLEYFEIADSKTLKNITNWSDSKNIMGFIVVKAGAVRLLDNIVLIP